MNELKETLKNRFEKNVNRHEGVLFDEVWNKLTGNEKLLEIVFRMEETGGCPDVVKLGEKLIYFDAYTKISDYRKSLCYDREALDKRKKNKPRSDVISEISKIGSKLVTEELYYEIQDVFSFDENISSWVKTPREIRDLGGAIFCDRRFNRTFTYHNTAESYYSSRGFRGYILL
ncbi:MAG: DUF4256 domain-containing protein [Lagierella massiliensis]|nr:DUF4256 domain-containing protein [Lagierella massiliensis]